MKIYSEICRRKNKYKSNIIDFNDKNQKVSFSFCIVASYSGFNYSAVFHYPFFGSDALGGGSQVCLLVTTALCSFIGIARYGVQWKDIEHAIVNNITGVSSAIIILLIIGSLSATWMLSGVVPTLIYYGVQVIHPHFFWFLVA